VQGGDRCDSKIPFSAPLGFADLLLKNERRKDMINVIASIRVKAGRLSDFLEIFKANMIKVREERGCIEYFPTVDIDAELPPQILDENVVTIIERWENLEALRDHLKAPHMLAYREKVKDMVEDTSIKVLKKA
jgi:quinol monooxygenase YgiN